MVSSEDFDAVRELGSSHCECRADRERHAPVPESPVTRSDELLLSRVAAGDRAAFTDFYDRHAARVLGLLVRMIGDRASAEDVLQETFWRAWSRASQYDPTRASAAVWISLIARSRAIDLLRRRPRAATLGESFDAATPDDTLQVDAREQRSGARRALDQLPHEQRQAILLAFFGGLTHEQIAAKEQQPLGTVKTRIRLGMKRLRDILQPAQTGMAS